VKGHNLRLADEPTEEELKQAIGDPLRYKEIVFCGYGEPLLRLDLVKKVAQWVRLKKGRVRIDTNGHGNLIYGRNILTELAGIVDSMSISLNAQTREVYNAICNPAFENAYEGMLSFIREAKEVIPHVQVTVVALPQIDIERCREIAKELGVDFKVRELDVVG
jgi:TatD DNase family protein